MAAADVEKFRLVLDMCEAGIRSYRQRMRREHPFASDEEIEARVQAGLAVAFRAEPRFTKDVDLAVAVTDDQEAEDLVNRMQVRGYALTTVIEQDYVNRLATARLVRPATGSSSAFIDLLFASSGIEPEIASSADRQGGLVAVAGQDPAEDSDKGRPVWLLDLLV